MATTIQPTRTEFSLTYDPSNAAGGESGQAEKRYESIGAKSESFYYPSSFDSGFNVPQVTFTFLNAYGDAISNGPTLQIKMPGLFNVTGISDYSRTENIFGGDAYVGIARGALSEKVAAADKSGATGQALTDLKNQIGLAGITGAEAFQYSVKKGLSSILGFVGSAGLSNSGQFEFNARRAINPMAQLLYKGPQIRRYQFPFSFKPRNKKDTEHIKKIIGVFRVASATSVASSIGGEADSSGKIINTLNAGAGNSFTFGYPHLTKFYVSFSPPTGTVKHLFRSRACAIESVSVDYGGEKMAFFEDGSPTDVNLTIQLTEVVPRTLGDAILDANDSNITLG